MGDTTDWGFPKGRVAKALREILDPNLTEREVEAIVVCLMAQLLIESRLNQLLFTWLNQDGPKPGEKEKASKSEDALWKSIGNTDFAKKYSLVQPFFETQFPDEAPLPWKINDLRNHLFHGRPGKDAQYRGQKLSDEQAIEQVFLDAQFVCMRIDEFVKLIDRPHALAERWRERLTELGEPLF